MRIYPQTAPHFVKVKIFQGRFVVFLPSCEIWSDCNTSNHAPSCGLAFAPTLPAVRYCLSDGFCLYRLCRSCAHTKKAYIHKKTQKSFVTLLPMAESLVSHGFHGNKTHIFTLLPFVTAPVF